MQEEVPVLQGAYLLHGEEEYSKEQAIRQAGLLPDEAARSLNTQKLTRPSIAEIRDASEALPFFDRCRVVTVYELPSDQEAALAEYVKEVPDSTILLIVQRGEAKKTSALYKTLEKADRVIDFARCDEARATAFLKKRATERGVAITPIVAHRIIEMVGLDMASLESALYRVSDYVGAGKAITEDALKACITPNTEYRVFDMLSKLMAGNTRDGYRMLQGMLQSGESALGLASFLEGRLKLMLSAKRMVEAGMNEPTIVKALGGNPYAAKKSLQEARKCSTAWLCAAVKAFADVDAMLKQGRMREKDSLMLAVMQVFEKGGAKR